MIDYSKELLFNEKISIKQSRDGYRFSIDPIILANLVNPGNASMIADFGTGSGIIPMVLCKRFSDISVVGFEIQKDLADLADLNVSDNGLENSVVIENLDINNISERNLYDYVVSNPPYIKKGAGRINPVEECAIARHEIKITIKSLVSKASDVLKKKGRLGVIYPAMRLDELIHEFKNFGIAPKVLTIIYSKPMRDASLVFLEGVKGGKDELKVTPPFYIYGDRDEYSEVMGNIIKGQFL